MSRQSLLRPPKVKRTDSKTRPVGTSTADPKGRGAKPGDEPPRELGFRMPAFSLPTKRAPKEAAKQKKKMIRRNKPPGEDVCKLKEIVRSIRGKNITVQEFIGLIAPSTGDNGDLLRSVLAENLTCFRTAARKIYETMTEDISDVLKNEHIQLNEVTNEKEVMYNDKIVRIMNEIYHYCPEIDFERYYTDKMYLLELFPLAPEIDDRSDEQQALMRQEAYHRYQWLKSEGERLKDENTRLQKRMSHLKKQQREELRLAAERERQAELERAQLQDKQEELEDALEQLNDSVEKALVESEDASTDKVVKLKRRQPKNPPVLPKKRTGSKGGKLTWAENAAAQIQTAEAAQDLKIESSKLSVKSKASSSKTSIKKKKRRIVPPKQPQEGSPFHYSPPKTPPEHGAQQQRQASPFHYSPPRSPPAPARLSQQRQVSPFHFSPPREPEAPPAPRTRVESTTTVVEPRSSGFGRSARGAPRDSWGGFH